MIRAECHSGDFAHAVKFDATPWFEQATEEQIFDLVRCQWGRGPAANAVADFFEGRPGFEEVSALYAYLAATPSRNTPGDDTSGLECNVHAADALAWLWVNRDDIMSSYTFSFGEWISPILVPEERPVPKWELKDPLCGFHF